MGILTVDKLHFFLFRPAFDLGLAFHGAGLSAEFCGIAKFFEPEDLGEFGAAAGLVGLHPAFNIIGNAGVQSSVHRFENIDVPHF